MPKYKYIFFDNDGILVNTEMFYFEANRQILKEKTGYNLTVETYQEINLKQGKSILALAGKEEELRSERNKIYEELIKKNKNNLLLPGVKEILQYCKKK